jgi:hypothetical protein
MDTTNSKGIDIGDLFRRGGDSADDDGGGRYESGSESGVRPAIDPVKHSYFVGLAQELIADVCRLAPHIQEGPVMSRGAAPYRRLDCDRRALAYVRARPRKEMVRIDLSGLWRVPRESRLMLHGSGSSATLMLRSAEDKSEAIAFLIAAVDLTRSLYAEERAREVERKMRRVRARRR